MSIPVRITTANIAATLGHAAIRSDYHAAAAESDILCTQEDQHRDSALFMPRGWHTIQFKGGSTGRCSIHYRAGVFNPTWVKNPLLNLANGLAFPGAKRIAVQAALRDNRTGRVYTVTNGHFVPHADSPRGGITPMPRGRKAVTPAISSLIRINNKIAGQRVIVGDFNIDLDKDIVHRNSTDMLERMNRAGFRSDIQILKHPTADTHGHMEYDWMLFNLSGRGVHLVRSYTHPKRHSDHRAKTSVLSSTPRRGWKTT